MTAVVAYVPDLLDRSRVSTALPGARFVAGPEALAAAVAGAGAGAVALVDLARPDVLTAVAPLVARGVRVLGFGAHVADELLAEARRAGLEVHPRSRLFRDLSRLLAEGPPARPGCTGG